MNISKIISTIIMQYGLYAITLPFKDENNKPTPTENVVRDIIKTVTIPEFSQFAPLMREEIVHVGALKKVDERNYIYLLPPQLTITPVMYVSNVKIPVYGTRGTYGDIAPAYGINRSAQGVITSQAYMMLAGQMRAEPTFKYMGNNKIQLQGYPKSYLEFVVACEHSENLETLDESYYDSFLQLAVLDVKMFLYNNLKLYDGITTAHGNISLKTEDYQSAEADRHALLENWRDVFHLDMDWEHYM